MRQVGIKQLKANLSKELQDLPFEVTTKGAVVAQVTTPMVTTSPASDHLPLTDIEWRPPPEALIKPGSRYDRPPLDLSKEAQAKGRMGH